MFFWLTVFIAGAVIIWVKYGDIILTTISKPNKKKYKKVTSDRIKILVPSSYILSSNVYLIENGRNSIIVDTGSKYIYKELIDNLQKLTNPRHIVLIVLTHSHFDHTGCVHRLKQLCTKAKVVIHEDEKMCLHDGNCNIPRSSKYLVDVASRIGQILTYVPILKHYSTYEGIEADITVTDGMSLMSYGYSNTSYILHTPGHTSGSISVILDNNIALIGDLVGNGSVHNMYADDPKTMIRSIKKLLDIGIETFYGGHGPPFTRVEVLRAYDEYVES